MAAELTSGQRKFLRSAARTRRADVIVGKAGLDPGVLAHIRRQLDQRELVKVRLLESASTDRAAAAEQIAADADAALVDRVGRIVVLYRPNEQLPDERRIRLPG